MIKIGNVLVSDELIENCFCCDLLRCLGLCCVEGDTGAPLDPLEIGDLDEFYPVFKKYMTPEGVEKIEQDGFFDYDGEGRFVTPLLEDEACAYICYEDGIAQCAIEKSFLCGDIPFPKPISCHLYPIRVKELPDYEALNYHRWIVCDPAREKGEALQMPVYRFLQKALIRKYGPAWWDQLNQAVTQRP